MRYLFQVAPAKCIIGYKLDSAQYEALEYSLAAWKRFLNGEWTKEMPARSGLYPVLASDGDRPMCKQLEIKNGKLSERGKAGPFQWAGLIWSLPVPIEWLFSLQNLDDLLHE